MRNLKPYSKDAFEFHKEVVKQKRTTVKDPTYKNRLASLEVNIEGKFKNYNLYFDKKMLTNLKSTGYFGREKDDLHNLYSYQSKIIQELKIAVTTSETNRIINTCQNCTINEVNSFDHFVPQEEFSEFVVNPKNLFPSCTRCNGHKSTVWRLNNKALFLNLYLDQLPEDQILFVDIKISKNSIETEFYLKNIYNIDKDFFELIENHYTRLHLFQRFKENSNDVITEFRNLILSQKSILSVKEIIDIVNEKCIRDKLVFGHNYWKSILEITLVNNTTFMNSI